MNAVKGFSGISAFCLFVGFRSIEDNHLSVYGGFYVADWVPEFLIVFGFILAGIAYYRYHQITKTQPNQSLESDD